MVGEAKRSQEAIKEDVQRLRYWLDKQPHLPHDVEEEILTSFVCGTKTLENAKQRLDNFYSAKNRHPKLYDFQARKDTIAAFVKPNRPVEAFLLPQPAPDGSRVFILLLTEHFEESFDHLQQHTLFLLIVEFGMKLIPQDRSFHTIIDVRNVSANVATKLSPTLMATAVRGTLDCYPVRSKGVFFVNAPPFIEFIVNSLIKPVLKEKEAKRFRVTSKDITELTDIFPLDILPSNLGGKEKSSGELFSEYLDIVEENWGWFERSSNQRSDERKRPPDAMNTYGIEGTFRKLAVD